MNIIYFHTHDMGRFCEPYGYPLKTPAMQRLAEEGVLFRNAFCTAPTCSPSRASLMTGQYPHQNGMLGLTGQGWRLNDYSKHLAGFLGQQGYITALCGSQHEDQFPPDRLPYDEILNYEDEHGHKDRWSVTEDAIAFIQRKHTKPFFISIGYDHNHRHRWEETYSKGKTYFGELDTRYIRPLPHLPDHPLIRKETALLMRAIQYVDYQLNRVLEAVRESGLEEHTLIFFTSDHGVGFPHMKMNLTDGGTGVALMFRGPGGFSQGKVIDAMVSHLDVYPTLCELIGAEKPEWLQGQSLLPLVRGERESLRDELFLQQTYHGKYAPLRAVRTERFKYVKRYGGEPNRAYFNADRGETIHFLELHGYKEVEFPEEQLFDLYFDTNEICNVIQEPRYGQIAKQLRQRLHQWQLEKKDPILQGPIELPIGRQL